MPKKQNSNFVRCTSNAKRLPLLRDDDNQEEREVRLANNRGSMSVLREGESSVERSNRLSLNRITVQSQRQNESHDERNNRLSADSSRHFNLRQRRRNKRTNVPGIWSEKEYSALNYDPCVDYKNGFNRNDVYSLSI
ncbi:hypothetical protein AVEN_202251-1 [Araneus ventricosus]|uniref:Uncharacterized protein n=1 Tax=Araneus ventricosus TaxID=182803 RepID=A0A4Y2CPI2_ARAVE|nr:hypothetical protein AVEN_202251-1 [Araneus ventricosus]